MRRALRWLAGFALVGALVVLLALLFGPRSSPPLTLQTEPSPTLAPATETPAAYPAPAHATPTYPPDYPPPEERPPTTTPEPPPDVRPTSVYVTPIMSPTYTVPPRPTSIPTPAVTPIPTAEPPIIPGVVDVPLQPYWIYYWQDNTIWRVDNLGQDRELLINTYEEIGQWLTDHPKEGTDYFFGGPRVVISPDGQKLALVVVDKIEPSKGEPFTFSIYTLDIGTKDLKLLSKGNRPVWSPDSQRIAFLKRDGSLWIADIETGETYGRIERHDEQDVFITEFAWSADGAQLAYTYNHGMQRLPTIWLVDVKNDAPPRRLLEQDFPIYGVTWAPDDEHIFYLSQEGGRDTSSHHTPFNLWSVATTSGARMQLTQDMVVNPPLISPDDQWFLLSGYRLYAQHETYNRDLWLLSIDGKDLRRLTANQADLGAVGWSPKNGTHLLVRSAGTTYFQFSLADATLTDLDLNLGSNFAIGGTK